MTKTLAPEDTELAEAIRSSSLGTSEIMDAILAAGYVKATEAHRNAEAYKVGFEQMQRTVALLVQKAGGEVTINKPEMLNLRDDLTIESTLDVLTDNITLATRYAW